jgi:predicted HNH restriction endonuclease
MGRPITNSTGKYKDGRNASKTRTYMMERRDRDKQKLVDHFGDKCDDCGGTFPVCCYDFHHLNVSTKNFEIAPRLGAKWDTIFEEAKKCVMICSNCHRIRHYKER